MSSRFSRLVHIMQLWWSKNDGKGEKTDFSKAENWFL